MLENRRYFVALLTMLLIAVESLGCTLMPWPSWIPWAGETPERTSYGVPSARVERWRLLGERVHRASSDEQQQLAVDLIEQFSHESDPLVREQMVQTAAAFAPPLGSDMLMAALEDDQVQVRVRCCDALGRRGGVDDLAMLSETLRVDTDVDVRLAATRALGNFKEHNQKAVQALVVALDDRDPALQYRAMLSLRNVTGRNMGNDVRRWRAFVVGEHPETCKPVSLAERFQRMFRF